jgi:hypothetical protein
MAGAEADVEVQQLEEEIDNFLAFTGAEKPEFVPALPRAPLALC